MNLITTTELRTKTTNLLESLLSGEEVDLVHRSKIVATIKPKKNEPKPLSKQDIKEIINLARTLNFPKLSDKEIERRYRKHITEKYGEGLS